jgi:hypothetical protein
VDCRNGWQDGNGFAVVLKMKEQKAQIIQDICSALLSGDNEKAKEIACRDYPFVIPPSSKRQMTDTERTRIFIRDGFLDRYTGRQLVYPGTIILLSVLLSEELLRANGEWHKGVTASRLASRERQSPASDHCF